MRLFYKISVLTLILLSSESFSHGASIPEKENKEAYDFVKNINSQSYINYELDVQKIVEKVEEVKMQAAKTYVKDVSEVAEKINKVQQDKHYKDLEVWIKENQNYLFAKQTKLLPKVDYDITKEQREKDSMAQLLHNYRFKPDEVKNASITHYPLMIFVSSSIPKSSLKDLMIQSKQSGGILVFRGIVGSLKNTQEFLADISKDNVSAIIDPRLFDIFHINLVPTFVVLSQATQDCLEQNCQFTPKHDRITGNITLKYALEQIKDSNGDASYVASEYLSRINTGGKSS